MNERKKELDKYIIIGSVIIVKIMLMGFFSSDYQDKMFIPFVDAFLNGNNPYEYYYQNGLVSHFPYFPFMLLIESIGGILLRIVSPKTVFFRNILFKLPLLIFDLLGYHYIRKLNIRFKYVIAFYFCSPVILYATYMHGQLDLIPTVLLTIAAYYLLHWKKQNHLLFFAVFLGLSISTKFHIVAAVPILFLYLAKKKTFLTSVNYHLLALCVALCFAVWFWGDGFVQNVLFNKEQLSVFTVVMDYGSTQVFVSVLALGILYFNAFELNYFNRNLLLSMLTLLFAVFLILIAPMPAWFVWIVPFLAIYYGYVDEDKYKSMTVYALFNSLYIIYFVFLHQTQYVDIYFLGKSLQFIKISDGTYKNLVFTGLVLCLTVIIYKLYKFGIASNSFYRRRNIPFFIGIAGDSGSGKSRMIEKIEHLFGGQRDFLSIEGDGDHRWARHDANWNQFTALDPKANYLYRQATDIRKLKKRNYVTRVDYDHDRGMFSERKKVSPKKYIVICGLHSLYLPQMRKELDLKIYMDTDEKLRRYWKIQRDTVKRGYTKENIIAQIEKRIPDAEKYIYPQKQFADLVISYFDRTLEDCFVDGHDVTLSVKIELSIDVDVADFIDEFRSYGIEVEHILQDDLLHQTLIFDGGQLTDHIVNYRDFAEKCIPQYEDFLMFTPEWGQDVEGVIQLLLLYMISIKMREQ